MRYCSKWNQLSLTFIQQHGGFKHPTVQIKGTYAINNGQKRTLTQFDKQIQAYTVAVMLANCFPTQAYPLPPQMVGISDLWLRTVLEYDLQTILHSKKMIIIIK